LLSHQVLFIFAVPVWFLFGLVLAKNELQEKYFCKSSLLLGAFQLLGVLMGVYFIVPAVAEIDLVTLPRVALSQNFTDHFVYFTQFIWSKWGYQFSEPGIDDGMSFHLGLPQLTILLLGLALSLSKWIKFKKRPKLAQTYLWGFFAALLIMSVFLMLPVSEFFWLSLTFLKKIQFPWRILFLPSLSLAVLGAFVLSSINKPKMVAGIGLIVLVYGLWFARPGSVNQHDKYFYLQFPFTSSTQHENLPEGFDMNKVHEHKERLFSLGGEARFTEEIWKSNLHQYQIETTSDVTIVEHLAYFPGWEVYVNGQVAEVDSTNPEFPGVVTYKVSAGSHQVVTKWDENTTVRKVSDIVSLVAWVGLGIILYVGITMVPGRRWMSS
jgi:hypothetical protein